MEDVKRNGWRGQECGLEQYGEGARRATRTAKVYYFTPTSSPKEVPGAWGGPELSSFVRVEGGGLKCSRGIAHFFPTIVIVDDNQLVFLDAHRPIASDGL